MVIIIDPVNMARLRPKPLPNQIVAMAPIKQPRLYAETVIAVRGVFVSHQGGPQSSTGRTSKCWYDTDLGSWQTAGTSSRSRWDYR